MNLLTRISIGLTVAAVLVGPRRADAQWSYNVVVESVNLYGGGGRDLPNSILNGNQFQANLVSYRPLLFSAGANYQNNAVYDTDFMDPETGASYDYDTYNFDKVGSAISYFSGHGVCGYGSVENNCTTNSQCTSPNATFNQSLPGFCVRGEPNAPAGMCFYEYPHKMVTYSTGNREWCNGSSGACTSYVSLSYGDTKWGESAYSGAWAGAGTNGGVNMVVMDMSCGATPPQQYLGDTLFPVFAGAHIVSTIMPNRGDTMNVADRGALFAHYYGVNPNSSIGQSWMLTLSSLPYNEGFPCGASDYSTGGGHGINGCGANVSVSRDATATAASWHVNTESWTAITYDGNDATSGATWWYNWMFNYDEVAWPL